MKRKAAIAAVGLMLLLAGCHGGGGGGDNDDRSVELLNAEELESNVGPDDPATVKAKVTGDGLESVELRYTVKNRSGTVINETTVEMAGVGGDEYQANIPKFEPGFDVVYEVHAQYDGETKMKENGYTVELIKEVLGPNDTDTTNLTTAVEVILYTADSVDTVSLNVTRDLGERGTRETVLREESINETNVTFTVKNQEFGETTEEIDVEYKPFVQYGPNARWEEKKAANSYTYLSERGDVLYIPIALSESAANSTVSVEGKMKERAGKTNTYYEQQSNGEIRYTGDFLTNTTDQPFFIIDGDAGEYYNESARVNQFDRRKLLCDAIEQVNSEAGVKSGKYHSVSFVVAPEGEYDQYDVRGEAFPPELAFSICKDLKATSSSFVLLSADHKYGTYAHEQGHALFHWADYYGRDTSSIEFGEIDNWGLMGSGHKRDKHPAPVMAYHRLKEDWVAPHRVESPEDQGSRRVSLDNALDGGRPAVVEVEDENQTMISEYIVSARDPPSYDGARVEGAMPYPSVDSKGSDTLEPDSGLAIYGVSPMTFTYSLPRYGRVDMINVVRNPETLGYDTVTLRSGTNDTIEDPDANIVFSVETSPQGETLLRVEGANATNVSGVNVYLALDCENPEAEDEDPCPSIAVSEEGVESGKIGFVAETADAKTGVTTTGEIHEGIEGSSVVAAGHVRKVYVPSTSDAAFRVNLSALNTSTANATLYTQTVSRDEDGNRTASEIRQSNVTNEDSYAPELARLNTSEDRLEEKNLRPLENATRTVVVRNKGIRPLENVTVKSNTDWLTVEEQQLGTVSAAERTVVQFRVAVPGGMPAGNHTATVVITGDGTKGQERRTVEVVIEVLPTAYWDTEVVGESPVISDDPSANLTVRVTNSEASNVPLREVGTTLSGNATSFNTTLPDVAEALPPGESVLLQTEFAVPRGGLKAGIYNGTVTIEPFDEYAATYEYPVSFPNNYSVVDPEVRTESIMINAAGPSVNATTTFHPDEQTALRQGTTRQFIRVDSERVDAPPSERVVIGAEIPDGWTPSTKGTDLNVDVYVVEETEGGGAESGTNNGGKRVRLDESDFLVNVTDEHVIVEIPSLSGSEYDGYLTRSELIEVEYDLRKDRDADSYGYSSEVLVQTASPIDIYVEQNPSASVQLFDTPSGRTPTVTGNKPPSAGTETIYIGGQVSGENATLTARDSKLATVDGTTSEYIRFDLQSPGRSTRNVWIRADIFNRTDHEVVVVDGRSYVVIDGFLTRNVQGAISSALRNADDVTVRIPIQEVDGDEVTVSSVKVSDEDVVVLQNQTGATVGVIPSGVEPKGKDGDAVGVVVGPDVFDSNTRERGDDNND